MDVRNRSLWIGAGSVQARLDSNLVPRALFPGFGGGPKPGKSALGTRLAGQVPRVDRYPVGKNVTEFSECF